MVRTPADWLAHTASRAPAGQYLANMGIYLFRRQALFDLLGGQPPAHDLVMEIFPPGPGRAAVPGPPVRRLLGRPGHHQVLPRCQPGPGRDNPPFDFHLGEGVYLHRACVTCRPRASVRPTWNNASLVTACVVQPGTRIERCLLGVRSRGRPRRVLRDSVLIGADRFETDAERAAKQSSAASRTSLSATAA